MSERTKWGISSRYVSTTAKWSIGHDLIPGLIEMIYNSDDSYIRLEEKGKTTEGSIIIRYKPKRKGSSEILLCDFAEGMTKEKVEEIMRVGGSTSEKDKRFPISIMNQTRPEDIDGQEGLDDLDEEFERY